MSDEAIRALQERQTDLEDSVSEIRSDMASVKAGQMASATALTRIENALSSDQRSRRPEWGAIFTGLGVLGAIFAFVIIPLQTRDREIGLLLMNESNKASYDRGARDVHEEWLGYVATQTDALRSAEITNAEKRGYQDATVEMLQKQVNSIDMEGSRRWIATQSENSEP